MILLDRPRCRIPLAPDPLAILPAPTARLWQMVDLPVPETAVHAVATPAGLRFRFDCRLLDPARLRPPTASAPVSQCEHVWVTLWPRNDGMGSLTCRVDFRGNRESSAEEFVSLERLHGGAAEGRRQAGKGLRADQWQACHGIEGDRWWAEIAIPWRSCGREFENPMELPPVIGLAYGRAFGTGRYQPALDQVAWPDRGLSLDRTSCLASGEALLGPRAGAPAALDLGLPSYGDNLATLSLGGEWPVAAASITLATPDGAITLPVEGATVMLPWRLGRQHTASRPVLKLTVTAADGASLYRVSLLADRHAGLCLDLPYGESTGGGRSSGDDPIDRIARALPRLRRATTRDGAPSDFCLIDEQGALVVNLMAVDAWPRLAAIVASRFEAAADRLAGAMCLVAQKTVTNFLLDPNFFDASGKPSYHTPAHAMMGPLSILRFGGGPSMCRNAVLARLLRDLTNPATGQSFVTRVVPLGMTPGAPPAGPGTASFIPEAAAESVVAVEHQGGFALLDPTTLTCCPSLDAVSGPLAGQLRLLTADNIRRQPSNALLSHGVFPELALDENGWDNPATPGFCNQPIPIRLADEPVGEPGLPLLRPFDTDPAPNASLAIRLDGSRLTVTVNHPPDATAVHVALDLDHDHATFVHLWAPATGQAKAERQTQGGIQTLFKHLSTLNWSVLGPWEGAFTASRETTVTRFEIELPPGGPVIGLNAWLELVQPHGQFLALATPDYHLYASEVLTFSDLYLQPTPATVESIDLGLPTWGPNQAGVRLRNHTAADVEGVLTAETCLGMSPEVIRPASVTVRIPADDTVQVALPCWIDPREKMSSGEAQQVRVAVTLGGRTVFQAAFPFTYCTPPGVYQRTGPQAVEPPPDAPPGDLLAGKIHAICSRLPDFERLCTRHGAASDFVIRATDESVEFDLMQAGVMDAMGEYIARLFETSLDRVLGMFFLACHPAVARHQSAGHRYNGGLGPLSLIRLFHAGGGGNCGFHSRVLAGLLCHLRVDGEPLRAHTQPVWGHVITGLAWRGSKTILDGDVGHLFLTPDASDLATIEEIRAGRFISTAGPGELGRYLALDDDYLRDYPALSDDLFPGTFPIGAPVS